MNCPLLILSPHVPIKLVSIFWILTFDGVRLNKLNAIERELIIKRYVSLEEPRDCDIYNEMGISWPAFYRIREKTFYKLAFALRIEVYKEVKSEVTSHEFCVADFRGAEKVDLLYHILHKLLDGIITQQFSYKITLFFQ